MSTDDIEIRRLAQEDPADAVQYRDIRLEALQANPEAFGSTFELENAQPLSWFSDRLGGFSVVGAVRKAEVVGLSRLARQQGPKKDHKSKPLGMYASPAPKKASVETTYPQTQPF